MPNEDKPQAIPVEDLEAKRKAQREEEERKDKEICEKISKATGREIFNFMVKLKRSIGQGTGGMASKYMRLCYQRAKELNKDRYGDWEHAKIEVNHMPEPQGIYKTESLLPVLGYPCDFIYGKTRQIVLTNPKLNMVYIRELGSGEVSYTTAKKIFSS